MLPVSSVIGLCADLSPRFCMDCMANRGVEPTKPRSFFDNCLNSLLVVLWRASLQLRSAVSAKSPPGGLVGVFCHFPPDLPIHPRFPALYPHSAGHIGFPVSGTLGAMKYWWRKERFLHRLLKSTHGPSEIVLFKKPYRRLLSLRCAITPADVFRVRQTSFFLLLPWGC